MNYSRILLLSRGLSSVILSRSYGQCLDHRLAEIKNDEYRLRSAAGYYLLECMAGTPLDEIDIFYNDFGKPQVRDSKFHFSISHSRDAIICAVSDMPIGVDIEFVGNIREKVLNKCFTDLEKNNILTNKDFYKYWTLKEAYLKNLGTGINRSMTEIEIIEDNGIICFDKKYPVKRKLRSFNFQSYKIAICSFDDPQSPTLFNNQ